MIKERTATIGPHPPGYHMTELGLLPEEWKVVRLGEVASMKQGKVLSTKNFTDYGYPVFGANGRIGWYSQYTHEEPEVLVTCRGATCGTVNMSLPKSFITNNAMVVKPKNNNLLKDFLYFALTSADLRKIITGSGQPQITKSALSTVSIPLPPLPEQRAIAYVLRSVQEAKEKTENVINALKELKKSLMKHLFTYGPVPIDEMDKVKLKKTEIGRVPNHWKVVRLGEVATTTSGGTPDRKNPWNFGGQIPWVKSGELNDTVITTTEETLTEQGLRTSNAKFLPRGTLLIAMYGATAGKVGILGIEATTNQAICAVMPQKKDSLHIPFLFYAFIQRRETLKAERYGGAQPNLSQRIIRKFQIPLPPLSEQKQIAHILRSLDEKIESEKKRLEALDKVFKALLNDLMTAKRRVPREFIEKFGKRDDNHE